jgi:RHS repeat-associated protein
VTRTYTYGLQRISENQVIDNVWTPSFYGYDGFGTVRQLTNTAGAVTDTFEYDAFGNAITHTGTTPNNYLYRGEQFDPDLGFYYLRARYYNPQTGRFMSRDPEDGNPVDPATLHKYLYADGDPVNGIDPLGREVLVEYSFINASITKAGAYLALAGIGAGALCELFEITEGIREAGEAAEAARNGPVVRTRTTKDGINCGGGDHPGPGGFGHPEKPEPGEPTPAPIAGPPEAGAP